MELHGGDLFLLYTDGLYGVGPGDERRLAPAEVAKQLRSAPGNSQSVLQDFLHQPAPTPSNVVPADDIATLAVRRLEGEN
jgi:serine phosphatase RsbU (regulator of sigma subunit)